jgi:ABC-type multidrug transport system fused ATPase/permease subunit
MGAASTPAREGTAVTIWDFFVWFFWFYIAISCIWIFITIIVDVFRDSTLNGWAKALWVIFLVFLPFLAAIIYLIARGRSMAERSAALSRQAAAGNDQYIRSVAGTNSAASEIESGKRLLDSGAITPAEYETLKAKALAAA